MTIITPAGKMDFDWSPKEKNLVKTASKGEVQKSDKDILFEAAKRVIKAQMALEETSVDGAPSMDGLPCEKGISNDTPCGDTGAVGEIGGMPPPAAEEVAAQIPAEGKSDAVQAVKELADKAAKAEEVAGKVQDALGKVEEAVQGVKEAVGVSGGTDDAGSPEEVVMEVEVEDEEGGEGEEHEKSESPSEEKDEHEKGEEKKDEKDEDKDEDKEDKDEEKDDIIQKSCEAAKKKIRMETSAEKLDDFQKFSKISSETRKKVTTLWKDYLGYAPDYVKLMVTDYEK